jgi:methionyl-tRNA formyltransferase
LRLKMISARSTTSSRKLGAALARRSVEAIAAGTAPSIPQAHGEDLRPAPKLQKETGRLDFNKPAAELVNWVRGLSPIPTAFATLPDGRTLKIFRAAARPFEAEAPAPGTWASDGKQYLRVATADAWLDLLDVQLEGKKRMPVQELLRGAGRDLQTTAHA